MGSKVTVTVAILLLLAYGTLGAVTAVTSSSPAFLLNTPINLTFTGDTSNALVNWEKNSTFIIIFTKNNRTFVPDIYEQRVAASTPTSLVISSATHDDSGLYLLKVSSSSTGKVESLQFTVSIHDPVTNVTVKMTPDPVSEVTPVVNLTCSAASGAETFTWKKDGASLPSNINSSFLDGRRILQLNNPKETYNGNYTCNVSNPVNWDIQTKELKVYSLVNGVTVETFPKIVNESTKIVNLTCNASSGAETFTWQKIGASLLSGYNYDLLGGNRTLQIKNPNSTHNGVYTCNASNPASWANSSLTLVVYYFVKAVSVKSSVSIVSEDTPVVNLSCEASGGGETFSWQKDGLSLPSSNGSAFLDGNKTLQINNPRNLDSGVYTCNVSNPVNWVNSSFTLVVYYTVTGVRVTSTVSEDTLVVNLSCSASVGGETFTWQKDGTSLPSSYSLLVGNRTVQINNARSTNNGIYTCNVSNPASWETSSLSLLISSSPSALSTGAIIGIVIGSVCGALLLIALIILIVCCVKRRKGKKEKSPPVTKHTDVLRTVSGNTLSPDDPAFFTVNNIMYRNSSISMGSYNMDQNGNHNQKYGAGWRVSERNGVSTQNSRTPSVNPSINTGKLKHLTQV